MGILRYDSPAAYMAAHTRDAEKVVLHRSKGCISWDRSGGLAWDGGISGVGALRTAREGHDDIAVAVNAEMREIDATIGTGERKAMTYDVVGSRVCVPSALAGSPRPFRRRVTRNDACRRVGIWYNAVSSASINARYLIQRGAAVLALVEQLQRLGITTDLYLVHDAEAGPEKEADNPDGAHTIIRLETRPLDLATTGYMLAHPSFIRNVIYSVTTTLFDWRGGFGGPQYRMHNGHNYGVSSDASHPYVMALAELYGMQKGDIYIPGAMAGDELISNSEAWLNRVIATVTSTDNHL
jgi:hypothetical protein